MADDLQVVVYDETLHKAGAQLVWHDCGWSDKVDTCELLDTFFDLGSTWVGIRDEAVQSVVHTAAATLRYQQSDIQLQAVTGVTTSLQARRGGVVLACAANKEGARSMQDDLERLAGSVHVLGKHHCRAVWTAPLGDSVDAALLAQWRGLDAPRPILDGRFQSRPGLFAWDRIDAASALLAANLPTDLAGEGADLGAGWGYLAAEVMDRCPGVTALDLYEAEARALALARINLAGRRFTPGLHWHDVTAGLPRRYDFIVSNPPFHQGRADQPELGQAFIRVAAQALRPGGRLCLVANRHLPYEQALARGFGEVRKLADAGGFKVIHAVKAGA